MLTLAAIKENPQEIINRLKVKHFDGEALINDARHRRNSTATARN